MSSEILTPNYVAYRKDRSDGYGGVMIAIKSDLISEEITSVRPNSQIEAIFVKISLLEKRTLIIGGIYRPPQNDIAYATDLTDCMSAVSKKFPKAIQWFCGDFNLPDINWQSNTIEGHQNPLAINQLDKTTYLTFSSSTDRP